MADELSHLQGQFPEQSVLRRTFLDKFDELILAPANGLGQQDFPLLGKQRISGHFSQVARDVILIEILRSSRRNTRCFFLIALIRCGLQAIEHIFDTVLLLLIIHRASQNHLCFYAGLRQPFLLAKVLENPWRFLSSEQIIKRQTLC